MHFEFEHLGTPTPFELTEGEHLLGGGEADHIRLEGLPPGLLSLRIGEGRLMVEARLALTVAGVWVPPGVPRLVVPGEVVGLAEGMTLRVGVPGAAAERQVGTVAVLKQLLLDAEPLASRAASLRCLAGAEVGQAFALADTCTELGRGVGAAVRLRDPSVSRRHALIRQDGAHFLLEDQDSPNGVFLNGQRVKDPQSLQDGDVIELGRTLLRFQAPVAEPVPPPVVEPPPEPPQAPPHEPLDEPPTRVRGSSESWLLGLAGTLAGLGLLATWALAAWNR